MALTSARPVADVIGEERGVAAAVTLVSTTVPVGSTAVSDVVTATPRRRSIAPPESRDTGLRTNALPASSAAPSSVGPSHRRGWSAGARVVTVVMPAAV